MIYCFFCLFFLIRNIYKQNWCNEITKWLGNRVSPLPIDGGGRAEVINRLTAFTRKNYGRITQPILVISYETFRGYADIIQKGDIGLVLCDEVSIIHSCVFFSVIFIHLINKYIIGF